MAARPLGIASFATIFVLSGFMNALQARANGELTQHVGNGVQAALYSFGSGLLLLSTALAFSPSMRTGLRRIPPALRERRLASWTLPAGALGGLFIACQSYAVALVGVALFSVGMVAGQTASSLAVDRVGLSPIGRTRVTGPRVVAAVLAVVAVVVAVSGRLGSLDLQPVALGLAFVAGCVVAVQQALNGRVTTATLQPLSTTWLNFVFGSAILLVMALVGLVALGAEVQAPESGPWWMWLGGVFGIVFIVTGAWAVPRYGVLVFALVTIAGQLTAALVLDRVAPVGANAVQWTLVLGVVLTFLSVGIIAVRSR
jgi:bacterial/archaeal transporter family-2 protein